MVEVELHRKLGGKKPCPPGVKLDQILSDNLVNLLVNGGAILPLHCNYAHHPAIVTVCSISPLHCHALCLYVELDCTIFRPICSAN